MPTLAEIRTQYPQYQDMPDQALASALHTKFYSDMPRGEFDKKIGYEGPLGVGDIASSAWNDIKKAATNVAHSVYSGVTLPRDVITSNAQLPSSGAVPGSVEFGDPRSAGLRVADMAALAAPLSPAARAGEAAIPGVAKATVTEKAATPSLAEIDAAAVGGFNKAKNMGVDLAPQALSDIGSKVERKLQDLSIHEEHAPQIYKTIERTKNPPEGAVSTIGDLHNLRQAFGNAASNFNYPKEAVGARIGKDAVDEFMAAIPEKAVLAGPASDASAILKDAIGNSAAGFRGETVADAARSADLGSASANSGLNIGNANRQKFKSLVLNDRSTAGWSAEEIAQAERIARGTRFGNTARRVGNVLGGGGGLGHLGSIYTGAMMGGPVGAITAPTIGNIARMLANKSVDKQVKFLDEMIRARSPLAQSKQPITRELNGGEQGRRAARVRAIAEMLDAQGQR